MNTKDIYIVIPAKNEAQRIGPVITQTISEGFHNIVVVNDGSTDNTAALAKQLGAKVIHHLVSMGAGAATQTGIEYARKKNARIVVTIDGDNQHCPTDIKSLIKTIKEKELDVVIGSRFLNEKNEIPGVRIFYNKIGNFITALLTGLYVTDSQSGFKAMRMRFLNKTKINLNGYEFCTEIINLIKLNKATYTEVPIKVRYTAETRAKGQNFLNGVKMVGNLIKHLLM